MAFTEQGVGVLLQPHQVNRIAVGRAIATNLLLAESVNAYFNSTGKSNLYKACRGLKILVMPRLWTSATDPTDPGLTWGIDWVLGLQFGGESNPSVWATPTDIELAGRIALPATPALSGTTFANAQMMPAPGVEYDASFQGGAPYNVLMLQLAIQSSALQTAVAVVHLTLETTWSGN